MDTTWTGGGKLWRQPAIMVLLLVLRKASGLQVGVIPILFLLPLLNLQPLVEFIKSDTAGLSSRATCAEQAAR